MSYAHVSTWTTVGTHAEQPPTLEDGSNEPWELQNDESTTTEAGVKGRKSYTIQKKLDVLSMFDKLDSNVSRMTNVWKSPEVVSKTG